MMGKAWQGWCSRASVVLSMMAVGCGGSTPTGGVAKNTAPPAASVKAGPSEVHERVTTHLCPAKTKVAALLGHVDPPPAPASEQGAESAAPPTSLAGATRVAASQAYREVAPATVLIRTDRAMGTGIVIDPKGYILTNYHVVADGRRQDFVISVNVTFGDLTSTGRMTRQEKTYEAVVVKSDPIRDMAIIKVKDAPAKITAVKLARSAPQIAEKVMAVGHAGIGFLWAAKTCSVSSIGERQQDNSRLAAFDCSNADPSLSPAEATRAKKRCEDSKKEMTEALMTTTQGIAIQTDCAITHGDSGGPLVNAGGELVGLNQSISADLATASFHVHLDEIRDFISKYPDSGVAILPDPFCDGGATSTLEDIDLDGVPDTIVTKGSNAGFGAYDRMSLLIDLDETHFARKKKNGSSEELEGTLGQKIALLVVGDTTYVWYDTDDDSRFDLLLVDKQNDGQPETAYRIDANGALKEDKDSLPKHDLSAKFVKDKTLHARLAKIATAVGGTRYVSAKTLAEGSKVTGFPDPLLGGGSEGRVLDSDGDGKPDVVAVHGTFSNGMLIDADENSLGSLKNGDAADDIVKAKKVDAEASVIAQGSNVWAMYDTDNDSKIDLALLSANGTDPTMLVASSAWRVGPTGEMTLAPDELGRKLLRPGLLPTFPHVATAFRFAGPDVAADEGMGSLPDPRLGATTRFRARDLKGFGAATIVDAQLSSASTTLVDVDHDTKLPFNAKDADLAKVMSEGKFDAEVAIVHHSDSQTGSDWIYYDTDNDGKFDLVLFVPTSGTDPSQAYRLSGDKKLEVDASAVAGRPIRPSLFKDKLLASKFRAIAAKSFKSTSIEP